MSVNENRAFELLKQMAYERICGSEAELRTAQLLADTAAAAGAKVCLEAFPFDTAEVRLAALEVLEPCRKQYAVTGYLRSESTGEEGIEADLLYVENARPADLAGARGKLVLVNGRVGHDTYKALMEAGVRGLITFNGDYDRPREDSDVSINMLRPMLTDKFGRTIALNMHVLDAMEMVNLGASKVRVAVISEDQVGTSHNVIAEIPGTELPEEEVVFGAHYDSVRFSTGVYDNGAGSVCIMELLRHFAEHPPKRTVRFIWFGAEEIGLQGSKYYTANHDLSKVRLMVNLDVGGPVLGLNKALITGNMAFVGYVDGLMKEIGASFSVEQHIQSSDSTPFTDHDVPCANFLRDAAPGAGKLHSRADTLAFLSPVGLGKVLHPTLAFADRVINSAVFPIERVVPPEMHAAVDQYYFRK